MKEERIRLNCTYQHQVTRGMMTQAEIYIPESPASIRGLFWEHLIEAWQFFGVYLSLSYESSTIAQEYVK